MHIWAVFYLHSTYPQWVEIHFETGLPSLNIFDHHIMDFPFKPKKWIDFFFETEGKENEQKVFIPLYI